MSARRVGVLLGGCVLSAVCAATLAARHASPAEVSPVVPHGNWNAVWVASLVVGTAAAALGGIAVWRSAAPLAPVLAIAIAIQVVPLAAPLLLSKDVYLYWAEARIATAHNSSPYRKTPADFPRDVALPRVSEEWRDARSPYGPTWEALSLVPASVVSTPRQAVVAYRLLAVAGVLGTLLLIAWATGSAGAVALLGWSPLVALHFAGGGHSDGWLVLLIGIGVVARRRALGGGAWALAAAMKPPPIVFAPLDLAADRFRRPRRFWAGLGAGIAAVAVATAVWGAGWIRSALVGVHGTSPFGGVHWLMEGGVTHRNAVLAGAAIFAVVFAVLFVDAWRNGRARLSLAALALCLCSSLLRPWYGIWPLALAALELDAVAAIAAFAFSAYLLLADAALF